MDVREKLVELLLKEDDVCKPNECKNCGANGSCYYHRAANRIIANGVTVQECIPVTDVQWLGEDIAKLCIRYMTEYADFHGYASQKKVKAHIIRLLQAEADGRIAIMPQPPKGE